MCRTVVTIAAIAASVFVAASATSEGRSRGDRCADADGRTIRATERVRVFKRRGRTYACSLPSGRGHALGDSPRDFPDITVVNRIRINGDYVGYQFAAAGRDEQVVFRVNVLNVKTGRWRWRLRANQRASGPPQDVARSGVTDLALAANGSVGWLIRNSLVQPAIMELHAADRAGRRLLASDNALHPTSLALSGRILYWIQGGQARSALLD